MCCMSLFEFLLCHVLMVLLYEKTFKSAQHTRAIKEFPVYINILSNRRKNPSNNISHPLIIDILYNQDQPTSNDILLKLNINIPFNPKKQTNADIPQPTSIGIPLNRGKF